MPGKYISAFPHPDNADPDGLLAFGGNLSPLMLLDAYTHGIYPLFSPGEPVLWWCPDPRCVLWPENFHISTRSKRKIAVQNFRLTINHAFAAVMAGCAEPRGSMHGAWISKDIIQAYTRLYDLKLAFSVEAWQEDQLVGGLYGVALHPIFFGESMFHRSTEASRAALCGLVSFLEQQNYTLIDCQQESPHMLRMGASLMKRSEFVEYLDEKLLQKPSFIPTNFNDPQTGPVMWEYNARTPIWEKQTKAD